MLNNCLDLIERLSHLDACASVRILSWLDNPNIGIFLLFKLLVGSCKFDVLLIIVVGGFDIES